MKLKILAVLSRAVCVGRERETSNAQFDFYTTVANNNSNILMRLKLFFKMPIRYLYSICKYICNDFSYDDLVALVLGGTKTGYIFSFVLL